MEGICPDNKVRGAARRCGYNETAAACLVYYRAGCCREKGRGGSACGARRRTKRPYSAAFAGVSRQLFQRCRVACGDGRLCVSGEVSEENLTGGFAQLAVLPIRMEYNVRSKQRRGAEIEKIQAMC